MASSNSPAPRFHVPVTISKEAQAFIAQLPDPHTKPRFPDATDIEGWKKLQAWAEGDGNAHSAPILASIPHSVTEIDLGGIPALDIRTADWRDDGRLLVYTHGGAHTMYSARSMLGRALLAADNSKIRVVSIDYTLAPHAKFDKMTDQTVTAFAALLEQGAKLERTAIYGDSSGGGLAAATVLKMRDRGLGMPAAAVLVSPWLDVTADGDTETTLHDADPNQLYELHGVHAAAAFADPADQRHPYASPVYGDFSKGFPPTLIQGGLKETLLSGFVRFYQALDQAGIPTKLDLYEGMIHNFQDRLGDAPESVVSRAKMKDFLARYI